MAVRVVEAAHPVQVEQRERRRPPVGQHLPEVLEQRAPVAQARERVVRGREMQLGGRGGDLAVGPAQLDLCHRRAGQVLEHAVVAPGPLARLVVDRAQRAEALAAPVVSGMPR